MSGTNLCSNGIKKSSILDKANTPRKLKRSKASNDKNKARATLLEEITEDEVLSVGAHSIMASCLTKGIDLARKADIQSFTGLEEDVEEETDDEEDEDVARNEEVRA